MEEIGDLVSTPQTVTPAAAATEPLAVNAMATSDGQPDKLNDLIDLVGELVIASASANLLAHRSGQAILAEANSVVSHLVESIRDTVLQMRMVKIGETFDRIQHAAAETAKEFDKAIRLVQSGSEIEVDKSVAEKIGDPLMQLVHNALEHGIEPASVRLAQGKLPTGRIELIAFHDAASIVIEVMDDGASLDAAAIRAEAIENGVLQPDQSLSDEETFNLIFEPGFSGRGIGMDLVKNQVLALRGSVSASSKSGEGTRIAIRLPLTLGIIDGFLTGVAKSCYVIPLDAVVECIELANTSTDRDYINLRGEVLPYVRLRELFDVPGEPPPRENVVVVQYDGEKAGIVVDQLLGEFQTVIKPLGTLFRNMRGIGGSTILGSGEVALILDVQALTSHSASSK